MMDKRTRFISISWILLILYFANTSCVSIRKIEYFKDYDKFADPTPNPRTQKPIMPFDKLSIVILSTDEQTAKILNYPEELDGFIENQYRTGYLVDENGNIHFPFLGEIHVEGLITSEAAEKIKNSLGRLVASPAVVVKYIDNRITVIGEVNQQGSYPITRDKINIYEALALGGGITEWGDRRKVVLMRMEDEKPHFHTLDLSNSKIAYHEHFYILPNDVVIVEPLRAKIYRNSIYGDIWLTISSLITTALIYSRLR
jgi:polysaccharide biosynthesis/export protein